MLRDFILSCWWCNCKTSSVKLWNEKKNHISGFLRQLFFSSSFPGNFLSQSGSCLRAFSVQGNIKGTKVSDTKERICLFVFHSVQLRGVVKRRGAMSTGIWTISNSMFDITFISAFAKFGFSCESTLEQSTKNIWEYPRRIRANVGTQLYRLLWQMGSYTFLCSNDLNTRGPQIHVCSCVFICN